jgi:hypothetical protein
LSRGGGSAARNSSRSITQGVALVCAQYFKAKNVSGSPELVDNQTSRKLASVSEWSGVKIGE